MRYGIVGAMRSEIALLTEEMSHPSENECAGVRFFFGQLGHADAVAAVCGAGKVNAAFCTQILIDRFSADAVINIGVAGGIAPGLQVLDTVVATGLIQHDFDITPLGGVKGYMKGRDNRTPTVYSSDSELSLRLYEAACARTGEEHCHRGIIVSGDQFIAGSAQKASLYNGFHGLAAEMEGAAVAQVASANGVPFAVLRAVSDLADGGAPLSFEEVEKSAAQLAAEILLSAIGAA